MDQPPAFQVSVPPKLPLHPPNGRAAPCPLSVNEAFRFTPLTTSPLRASDAIALPTLRSRNLAVPLVSQADRKALARSPPPPRTQRQVFEWLDPILEHVEINYRLGQQSPRHNARPSSANAQLAHGLAPKQPNPAHATPSTASQLPAPSHERQALARQDFAVVPETALRLRTQKEQGDAAIAQLQDLLTDIFDAEDRSDPSSGNVASHIHYFSAPDADEDFALRLTSSVHEKLQSLLKRLVALKRLNDVDLAALQRLQQLCAPAVAKSLYLAACLDPSPSGDDVSSWLDRLARLENGESAAVTFLYTCLGTESDRLHQQADTLSAIPGLLKHCFERLLIPVIEARPDGHASQLFALALNKSEQIKKLLDTSKKLLDILTSACVQLHEARDCVSETEFLASTLIFAQNAPTDKAAALGPQTYERVRKQAMSSLACIFAALPHERSTILDNLLSSLDRLPSTSRSARQFKV
ncbi:hypothetical protein DV736_g5465, partial [Chaetothyriales sp. CBS 134916]